VELLGVPAATGRHNISAHLAGEVDQLSVLPETFWSTYLRPRDDEVEPPDDELVAASRAQGEAFARHLVATSEAAEIDALLRRFPHLPHELDLQLLAWAERSLGSLRKRPDLKTELRAQFWFVLKDSAALDRVVNALAETDAAAGSGQAPSRRGVDAR
jgi:hypothetical protein